jgi:hypothetical protein
MGQAIMDFCGTLEEVEEKNIIRGGMLLFIKHAPDSLRKKKEKTKVDQAKGLRGLTLVSEVLICIMLMIPL